MQLITTVTDTAASYDLTSLANVKSELGLTVTTNDGALRRYITSASMAAINYCNRPFVVETVHDQFLSRGSTRMLSDRLELLQLSRWPISDLTSVVVDGTTLVENTDFLTDVVNGQLTKIDSKGNRCRWHGLSITVIYDGGFDAIPVDVEDAVIRMVTRRYAIKGRDPNLKQQNIPGVIEQSWWISTGTDSGNMAPDISDILDNYRVPVVQ